jgi:hypothetical protein
VSHSSKDGRTDSEKNPTTIELDPDAVYLINPGSVGQPRDDDWRAACAIYDSEQGRVDFARVEYDRAAFLAKAEAAGLMTPPSLAQRSIEAARSRVLDAADLAARAWRRARRRTS